MNVHPHIFWTSAFGVILLLAGTIWIAVECKNKDDNDNDTDHTNNKDTTCLTAMVGGGITAGLGFVLLATAVVLKLKFYPQEARRDYLFNDALDTLVDL